jgi:transposase
MYTKQEIIIRSHREGKSHRKISRELQISRKTVKKYIEDYERLLSGISPARNSFRHSVQPSTLSYWHKKQSSFDSEVQSFIDAHS